MSSYGAFSCLLVLKHCRTPLVLTLTVFLDSGSVPCRSTTWKMIGLVSLVASAHKPSKSSPPWKSASECTKHLESCFFQHIFISMDVLVRPGLLIFDSDSRKRQLCQWCGIHFNQVKFNETQLYWAESCSVTQC